MKRILRQFGLLLLVLLLSAATARATSNESERILRVYGPGGPHHVIEECASLFTEKHGVKVAVVKAFPHDLEQRLRTDGDIYYGGAEYMLENFNQRNPGLLDMTSADKLHPRRIGIIVRKGNPLGIDGIDDLGQDEINLLDVKLEKMRHFHGAKSGLSPNIRSFAFTGQQGVEAWRTSPGIDAWVTYKSWHFALESESDFIEIPGEHGLRHTPIALTTHTPLRQEAMAFIAFLKSDEGRQVFEEHGWY